MSHRRGQDRNKVTLLRLGSVERRCGCGRNAGWESVRRPPSPRPPAPVLTPAGSPHGLCAGAARPRWYTLVAADRIGWISLDGGSEEFPLSAGSMPSLITAGPDGALWCTLNPADA